MTIMWRRVVLEVLVPHPPARVHPLLADPARARAMGEAGYARLVSDFTVQKYADQVEALYDDVLQGRAPRDAAAS